MPSESEQIEEALRASEARLRQITDNMLDVVSVVDLAGVHSYVSPSIAKVLGYDPESVIGKSVYDFVHPDDLAQVVEIIQEALATRSGARMELRYRHADGHYVWLESMGSFLFGADGEPTGAILTSRDVTARRQRENELQSLALVSASLRAAPARAEMAPVILDLLMTLLEADGVALAMRDADTGETTIELARGYLAPATGARLQPGESISQRVVACIPLCVHDQTIGALWLDRTIPLSDAETRLSTAIADIAANAIHRAALYEQTQLRLRRLDALSMIDKAITSSLDLEVTLNILLDQVTLQLRVDAAAVLLYNPHTQTLHHFAARGLRGGRMTWSPLGLNEDEAGQAVLAREIIRIPDLAVCAEQSARARRLQGEDFRTYFAVPLIAKGQVKGVLEIYHRALLQADHEWLNFMELLARGAAIAIDNIELFQGLQRSNSELVQSYDATLEGWSRALDLRDNVTEGHTQRVVGLTLQLANALKVPESELGSLRRGALLHDIGKIGIPDAILRKPGMLVGAEWEEMRKHPIYARAMLAPIAYLRPAIDIPYCHHEHWDGSGYPRGLRGDEIPFAARLFTVVDVWDALRSDRPYRTAMPIEHARAYIHASRGTLFDPQVVETFLDLVV
jgi:PAS domain S-box-containing protein